MGIRARIAGGSKGRLGLALLVLLLGVRVATAAAVDCQHEMAKATTAADRAQEARLVEVRALGGALCLVEAEQPAASQDHDTPHLTSPCPFFKSPLALPDIVTDSAARIVAFSRLTPIDAGPATDAQGPRAAYSSRAPPRGWLG